jgi:hypothetical protein
MSDKVYYCFTRNLRLVLAPISCTLIFSSLIFIELSPSCKECV